MNGLWIILVMAGIVLPLFARFKRTMAEPVDSADETARMESNDESDDSFFDFGDTETKRLSRSRNPISPMRRVKTSQPPRLCASRPRRHPNRCRRRP